MEEVDPWSNAAPAAADPPTEPLSSPSVAEVLARAAHELDMEDELVPMLSADDTAEYNFQQIAHATGDSAAPASPNANPQVVSSQAPPAPVSAPRLSQRMAPPPRSNARRPPPPPRRKPATPSTSKQ
ncbi:MAG TPA: hypothetical protein ENK23_08545 [Sorangium sp.]|nr:hypothetical protein [Sorangium sp.]